MFKVHKKFGNFFFVENDTVIAMCTQSTTAKRVRNALQAMESASNSGGVAGGQGTADKQSVAFTGRAARTLW